MTKKIPLTKKKSKWVENRAVVLRGQQLNYNAAQQRKYVASLKKIINEMIEQTNKEIIKLFNSETSEGYFERQDQEASMAMDASIASQAKITLNELQKKFFKLFRFKAKKLAVKMVDDLIKISKTNLHSSLKTLSGGLSLKTGIVSEGVKNVATAIVAENVSYIKSIPENYFKNVTGAVMRSITSGNGLPDLLPQIKKYANTTEKKAKLMALDQTRKAYSSINKQRLQNVGVKQFEWIHSYGGQAPRESHIKINGHIFSFEHLEQEQAALGVPEADRGIPGHAINCRCTMNPVIDFSED